MNWWPNTVIDKVSSLQEEYVDNQYFDVKEIDHSDLESCELPVSIKTNKSEEEKKNSANDAYNKSDNNPQLSKLRLDFDLIPKG